MAAVVLRGLESKPKLNGREVNLALRKATPLRWRGVARVEFKVLILGVVASNTLSKGQKKEWLQKTR